MKKVTLLLFVFVFMSAIGWTQMTNSDPFQIVLNGKSIVAGKSISQLKRESQQKAAKPKDVGAEYYILQFTKIPTLSEQQNLAKQGIKLLDYIQGNAYYAKVLPGFYNSSDNKAIRAVYEINPEYKISEDVASGEIPEYALVNSRLVKLVLTVFDQTDKVQIEKDLRSIGAKNVTVDLKFRQANIEVDKEIINKLAAFSWVQNIEFVSPPNKFENTEGRSSHRANVLNSSILGVGYGLTGKGVKLGLWDGDVDSHRDFSNRVTRREFEMHTTDHGTHTAGTIGSAGILDPKARGMAPDINIYAWNFNTQSNGLNEAQERLYSLENDGIEITSNSWGYNISSCPNPYAYNSSDRNEDLVASWYPYFLYVFSAGNAQDVCPTGYNTTSKNLKNSLIVAAIDRVDDMSWFSSFGPSKDGRLIPNITGDGVGVYSTFLDNTYGFMNGTSMATPGVAGTMALVYERYKDTHGGDRPVSSFMRALACNTAYDLGNPGPDYKYGYGAINGLRAVEVMEKNNYFVGSVSQSNTYSKDIVIPAGAVALKVMLAWTDVAGTPGAAKILVNDLNLKVIDRGNVVLPWILNPANPSANAVRGIDNMNNLEQVTISQPIPGTYTVSVDGALIPSGVQEFAVVYDIVMPQLRFTYPVGNESFNPGNQEVIRWDCEGYNNPFVLEFSLDGGSSYQVIASGIPANKRSYLWTVPNGRIANAKFRISSGSTYDVTSSNFNIEPTPVNIKIASAQCDGNGPFAMTWNAVENANYKVYKLNGQEYEFLADVTTNSYNITGISTSNDNYFCVRAIDKTTGALSERSLAATVNPATVVASLPFRENFESQKATNFYVTGVKGQGNVRFVNTSQKYGFRLEGTSGATSDWVSSTGAACFTNNPTYVVKASICNINASSIAAPFRLKFDYRQKYRTATGTSYFRVKVNGNYLTNTDGTQIYGTTNQVNYKSVYYDISAYAGLSSVTVEFEAVCKTNYTTYINPSTGSYNYSDDALDVGDFVTINNI